ncbi:MAG TPA: ABC transporter ATP-binding protein [Oligoflexia bacterium]|nr:ABC transporter ATP-binding protein [Oligoflexia bacterium]HMP27041.1 ABC transporter ATP-binding protein [Oligoflexia bacterium]
MLSQSDINKVSVRADLDCKVGKDPMDSSLAVSVNNVTVSYRRYHQPASSLKESVIRIFKRRKTPRYSQFNALEDVSFSVKKGEIFAIIGSNGCGKSTLLKVLAGVLTPSAGKISACGSIASLIELGAGFDSELTAIENIFLHAALHRKPKKAVESKISKIIDFAELHDFADTPVKYYSSGMYARLGFAVAIDIDPDILLVDEILAVGDDRFQEKCKQAFRDFILRGKTIIWVTHNMGFVAEQAHRALLLQKGRVLYMGDPKEAVKLYLDPSYQTALA